MDLTKCKEEVFPNETWGSFRPHQCYKKIWKDGFCKIHHPETVEQRCKEIDKRRKAKMDASPLALAYKRIKELETEDKRLKKLIDDVRE